MLPGDQKKKEKMQNFGGHIFQAATPDFKVQTVYLPCKDCEKIPVITPQLRPYAINSVVFDYKRP